MRVRDRRTPFESFDWVFFFGSSAISGGGAESDSGASHRASSNRKSQRMLPCACRLSGRCRFSVSVAQIAIGVAIAIEAPEVELASTVMSCRIGIRHPTATSSR